jgi:hypothetical protein
MDSTLPEGWNKKYLYMLHKGWKPLDLDDMQGEWAHAHRGQHRLDEALQMQTERDRADLLTVLGSFASEPKGAEDLVVTLMHVAAAAVAHALRDDAARDKLCERIKAFVDGDDGRAIRAALDAVGITTEWTTRQETEQKPN